MLHQEHILKHMHWWPHTRLICRFGRTKEAQDITSPDQAKKRNAVKNLAAQSVLATMEVYDSLEAAAMLVLKSTGDASTGYVGHRCLPSHAI